MNILFLSPHTDDVELGCGGTMHRLLKKSSNNIYVNTFSTCSDLENKSDLLKKESQVSLEELGIDAEKVSYNDFKVRNFNINRQEILDTLICLREKINPDIVFLPSSMDVHQDHEVIYSEGVRCFKNFSSIYGYQLPWNLSSLENNFTISFDKESLNKKISCLSKYYSQVHRPYMNAEYIRSSAIFFGLNTDEEFAESFEVIRLKSKDLICVA